MNGKLPPQPADVLSGLAVVGERLLHRLMGGKPADWAQTLAATGGAADTEGVQLPERVARIRDQPGQVDAALFCLQPQFGLSDAELVAAALAFRVETDAPFAWRVGQWQAPLGRGHLLLGLLARAFALDPAAQVELACGGAVQSGLLRLGDETGPLPERSLAMPISLVAALTGQHGPDGPMSALTEMPVRFTADQYAALADMAAWLAGGEGLRIAVLQSADPVEARAAARSMAELLRMRALLARPEGPFPAAWLALRDGLPVYEVQPDPMGHGWRLPDSPHYRGPVLVLGDPDCRVLTGAPRRDLLLSTPSEAERAALWRGWGVDGALADLAARRYRQGAGTIARIAAGPAKLAIGQVADEVARGNPGLDALARRAPHRVIDEKALILPPDLRDALDRLRLRILERERLADGLGPAMAARYRPGVRALLTGESGTGKTLAAHWLADRLGVPLYRADMAALTSKWIGETEKNLSQLLAQAERGDAVLFFDEADALFGSRTDVSDAHDRYANAQTNFLLQRIEDFDGIALLSTNSRDRFDGAFARRLDAILEFPLPDPAARRELWCAHLGTGHALSEAEIDLLAREVDLAGGHIRNVVLGAAVHAGGGRVPIGWAQVVSALVDECEKLGRPRPGLAG